jgi:hypothetical protein
LHAQFGVLPLEPRQHARQHVGRERRNDAEAQPPGEQASAVTGGVFEIARGRENLLGTPRHLGSGFGEGDFAGTPLDELDAELALKVAQLHRQRGL